MKFLSRFTKPAPTKHTRGPDKQKRKWAPKIRKKSVSMEGGLHRYFEETYRPKRMQGKSERTIGHYHGAMRSLSRSLGQPAELADLTDAVLRKFADVRLRFVSVVSVRRDLDCLLALARFAWDRGDISKPTTISALYVYEGRSS